MLGGRFGIWGVLAVPKQEGEVAVEQRPKQAMRGCYRQFKLKVTDNPLITVHLTLNISGAPSAACRCYAAPDSSDGPLLHEHDLACHAALPEHLVRVSCLAKRKSLRY
jgi:hypothetical protein